VLVLVLVLMMAGIFNHPSTSSSVVGLCVRMTNGLLSTKYDKG
jgi:hypothetical protein